MDTTKSSGLMEKIISKEVLDKIQASFECLDRYKETIGILERTNITLGKKVVYKLTSGSSFNGNINRNVIGATY